MTVTPVIKAKQQPLILVLALIWGVIILIFTLRPAWRFIQRGDRWAGDYDIWFDTGRLSVCRGQAIYNSRSHRQPRRISISCIRRRRRRYWRR